jgi:hypothetical protein
VSRKGAVKAGSKQQAAAGTSDNATAGSATAGMSCRADPDSRDVIVDDVMEGCCSSCSSPTCDM